jgi:hypothetical protein
MNKQNIKIVEIVCIKDIKAPSLAGCGAYEYCMEKGLTYSKIKKGEIFYTLLDQWVKAVKYGKKGKQMTIPIIKELSYNIDWKNVNTECIYSEGEFLFKTIN